MKANSYDLIVVGGGIAGWWTAVSAKAGNPDLRVLVIRGEGPVTYSAPSLPDVISGHIPPEKAVIAREKDFRERGIELLSNTRVIGADADAKRITTDGGGQYAYRWLVLATGSQPIRPRRIPGTDLPGNYVLKTLEDAEFLALAKVRRAVVVGSGAIGLESASALKERGVEEVTLVEALDWLNPKSFDVQASGYMRAALERAGVRVLTGEGITSVTGQGRVEAVRTSQREIPCELVLWGVGMRPVTDLAVSMGAALGNYGGIRVDERMRTSLPDVYAAGDCTEPYDLFFKENRPNMLWRTATEQGMLIGGLLSGREPDGAYEGARLLFLTYVGESPACAYGYTEGMLKGRRYTVLEDSRERTYRKVLIRNRRIAGFQMVGTLEGANELYAWMVKGAPVERNFSRDASAVPLKNLALSAYLSQIPPRIL